MNSPDLPPGCSVRDVDIAAGAFNPELPTCELCGEQFEGDADDDVCPKCEFKDFVKHTFLLKKLIACDQAG